MHKLSEHMRDFQLNFLHECIELCELVANKTSWMNTIINELTLLLSLRFPPSESETFYLLTPPLQLSNKKKKGSRLFRTDFLLLFLENPLSLLPGKVFWGSKSCGTLFRRSPLENLFSVDFANLWPPLFYIHFLQVRLQDLLQKLPPLEFCCLLRVPNSLPRDPILRGGLPWTRRRDTWNLLWLFLETHSGTFCEYPGNKLRGPPKNASETPFRLSQPD